MRSMEIRTLIKALGGSAAVARSLGLGRTAVDNWCARDAVGGKHLIAVWKMARDAGIDWAPPGAEALPIAPVRARKTDVNRRSLKGAS